MKWTEIALIIAAGIVGMGAEGCPPTVVTRIIVETTEVEVSPDGLCSLIEAIENVNSGSAFHSDCEAPVGHVEVVLDDHQTYTLYEAYQSDFGLPRIEEDIDIVGNGSIIERAHGAPRFGIIEGRSFSLVNVTIRNAGEGKFGVFALRSVRLERSRISQCDVAVEAFRSVTLVSSTLDDNMVGVSGGCIYPPSTLDLEITIKKSTISNNREGGVRVDGCGHRDVTLELLDSTVSGNSADLGGGVFIAGGTARIWNSTVVGNTALTDGGGIYTSDSATVDVWRSIIAQNEGLNCGWADVPSVGSRGYNLTDDDWCDFDQPTDVRVNDAMLSELGDWGGDTLSHLPLEGSPAIDMAGPCAGRDQRRYVRPWDGNGDGSRECDCGSVEVGSHPVPGSSLMEYPRYLARPEQQ